jgi:hypothetical protein
MVFWTTAGGSPAERARITSGGDLLVGATSNSSPSARIHVSRSNASQNEPLISFTDAQDNTGYLGIRSATEAGEQQAYIAADTGLSFGRFITGSYTERARITAAGEFVVGSTTSAYTSSGRGVIEVNGSSQSLYGFRTGGTARGYLLHEATNLIISNDVSTGALTFQTNATERARITSDGDWLVGTTNNALNAGVGIKLRADSTAKWVSIVSAESTAGGGEGFVMYSTGAAAYRFYVNWAGTIYATNTTISGISDQRLKENVRDLDVGLDAVLALKPRKFDWKEGKGKDIKGDRGFIAQEFEQVFPDLVDEWRDPAPEGEEPYKSVRQDLIPVLVKAIQELKAELDATKAEVAALKGA